MKSMLKSLMSVVAAALALTSCSTDATEDVMPNGGSKTLVVNASIDRTRTFMKADDHKILEWTETDEIHLYIGADATKANSINPKSGGKITGVMYKEGDMVYANYSLNNDLSNSVREAKINIVTAQKQSKANVFEGTYLPMVASGPIKNGTVNLAFQPVGCVLVFNVYGQVKNEGEKIQSITFETSVKCCGNDICDLTAVKYCGNDICDLTAETLGYTANGENNVTVTLDTPVAIGTSKPAVNEAKIGGDQVYLVVAQANYPAGSKFIVTTDAKKNNTYTFVTEKGIDCSQNTARVVNLNLEKSEEFKPSIEVPYVPLQSSNVQKGLVIAGITFKNITELDAEKALGVYSDAELNTPFVENPWLELLNTNAGLFASGDLYYCITKDNTTAEIRTAYIGIKCVGKDGKQVAQASIPIRQVGEGCMIADVYTIVTKDTYVREDTYQEHSYDDWIVTCGGLTNNIASLGSDKDNADKRTLVDYPAIAEAMGFTAPYNDNEEDRAAAVISKTVSPAGYNTVTLEYNSVVAKTKVGIAFSTDNKTWTKVMDFQELSTASAAGSKTYKFPQQEVGYYAFVAKATEDEAKITECKITYSQQ